MGLPWLCRHSIRHPKWVMGLAVVITLAIAPGALRLKLRTDGHALVPTYAPEILLDRSIRDEFDVRDPIVVVIWSDHPDGVFNVHTLLLVDELTKDFAEIEGIRPVDLFSLGTEYNDRVWPGTLRFQRFLDPFPTSARELHRLRDDLQAIRLYTGTLVSYNEKGTAILVGVPPEINRIELFGAIRDVIAAKGVIPESVQVIGAPVAEALLGTHLLEDLGVPTAMLGERTDRSSGASDWRVPETLYELRVFIGRHIGLVPVAVAVMALVFLVSFRSLSAVGLPLLEVGACLITVFGLMGFCGVPVYLTIAVLPVILTAIGVADEIHIFARYTEQLRCRPCTDHVEAITATMTEMWVPVVKTSVTTAVGFLSFALSPIAPVRAFGVFTAFGIIFCMFWSLTVIPAQLAFLNPRGLMRARLRETNADGSDMPSLLSRWGRTVIRHRLAVIGLVVLATIFAPYGVRRIVVQDSWIGGFAPDSEFFQATQLFNEQFLGTHILLVCADAGHKLISGELSAEDVDRNQIILPVDSISDSEDLVGWHIELNRLDEPALNAETQNGTRRPIRRAWKSRIESVIRDGEHVILAGDRRGGQINLAMRLTGNERLRYEITPQPLIRPEVLRRIDELEAFIEARGQYAVGGVIGTADYLATANFMRQARKEQARCIPETPGRVRWVWAQYERIRGTERRRQVVDEHFARSLVTVFLKNANFVDTQHLLDEIRAYERTELNPHGIKLEFAGDVAVSQTLIDAIVTTQTRSLLLSLVGIFVVTALLGRSLLWGLCCVLPCVLAVLFNFAVMGWVSMPLGVATSMFAGMTLGIGVDYAIHLMERCRLAHARGLGLEAALIDAVSATGPAIIIDALAVALGFGVMILSQVPANARLGGLVVLSIAGCLTLTLILLPALVRIWAPRPLRRAMPTLRSDAR